MHQGRFLEQGIPREMLRSFSGHAFRAECQDRNNLAKELDGHPAVIALSPAGGALRVVATHEGTEDVKQIANQLGATLHPIHPVFEDVFLAKLRDSTVQKNETQ
jgi:hypothetical protein